MKWQFGEIFDMKPQLTDDEKKEFLLEFSNNFTQAHKLMAWIEDPIVDLDERTKYFNHMYCIFDSMLVLIKILMNSGLKEKEIITALNEVPF